MAVSQSVSIALDVLAELQVTGDMSPGSPVLSKLNARNVLRNGTATGLADLVFADRGQIAASGTTSLDLAGGALLDPLGRTLVFAKLKAMVVVALSTNNVANNIEVTRPASNGVPWAKAAGDAIPLVPGGIHVFTSPGVGVTVTADTGDLINLVNSAGTNTVDYDIVLVGSSA